MLLVEEYKSYWSYIVLIHSTCPARPKSPCESSWNRWCRDLESWDNWWGIFRRTSPHPMQGSLLLRHFIETLGLMVLWYQRLGSVSWTFFSNGIPPYMRPWFLGISRNCKHILVRWTNTMIVAMKLGQLVRWRSSRLTSYMFQSLNFKMTEHERLNKKHIFEVVPYNFDIV